MKPHLWPWEKYIFVICISALLYCFTLMTVQSRAQTELTRLRNLRDHITEERGQIVLCEPRADICIGIAGTPEDIVIVVKK